MTLSISQAHRDARSQATISFADINGVASQIHLKDAAGNVLVTLILSLPCGTLEQNLIRLDQASPTGDQIVMDGIAVSGHWLNSNGVVVAEGTVSDAAGTGDFKISSAAGVNLYAGGYVLLGVTALS